MNITKKRGTARKLQNVIVRTYSAGCFWGDLVWRKGKEVEMRKARRLWFWDGAATLSQLAQSGTTKPEGCKWPEAVDSIILTEAIEIISVTPAARRSLQKVPIWKS